MSVTGAKGISNQNSSTTYASSKAKAPAAPAKPLYDLTTREGQVKYLKSYKAHLIDQRDNKYKKKYGGNEHYQEFAQLVAAEIDHIEASIKKVRSDPNYGISTHLLPGRLAEIKAAILANQVFLISVGEYVSVVYPSH